MAADERLLAGVRRFWTRDQVNTAYQTVLSAYGNSVAKEVIIIGTSFDGQNTNAQVTLSREDMAAWLDVLETRLTELDDNANGNAPLAGGGQSVDFSQRYVGT